MAKPSRPPSDDGRDDLAARIAALEAENARLQAAVPAPRTHRRVSWRSASSALLIVVAAVLVPVSIIAGWARVELVDEETFVATFAPLAAESAVQHAITVAAVDAIEAQVDLGATTEALFDGIGALGLPPDAERALDLLREPAAEGLHSLLRTGVEGFVASDLFAEVWTMALRTSHRALLATVAESSPDSVVIIDRAGQVVLQLGPVVERISAHLAANGFPLTALIPSFDASVVVAQSGALALVGVVHTITTAVGTWLPILAVVLLAAGIAIARRRRVATIGAAIGVGLGAAVFLSVAFVGAAIVVAEVARAGLAAGAVAAVVDQVLRGMRESAWDLLLIAAVTIVVAALLGSTRVRAAVAAMNARLAAALGAPAWRGSGWVRLLVGQRALVHTVLVAVPLLLVWFLPMHWGGIVVTGLVALLAWWFVSILRAGAVEPSPADATPVPA